MRIYDWRALGLTVLAFSFVPAARAAAQQRPTSAQAQELLRTRPELIEQLRKRVGESGLSPEQVRARLKAEGYPENLLDGYLPGATTTPSAMLRDSAQAALRSLGLVDSLDLEEADMVADSTLSPAAADSAMAGRAAMGNPDRIFGLDFFATGANRFQPNLAGPVDPSYRLGAGDKLVLILTGDVELTYELDVNREGFIVIPQVGQLYVANLTLGQLEDLLYTRLGRSYSGVRRGAGATTRFSISVSRLRSLQVFVAGDVLRPGSYRIASAGTAFTALYAAGGPTENGSLRGIVIRRGGKVVATLDAYQYLLAGDASNDVRLENGDVVFVPVHGARARVAGAVKRPATYELKSGESISDVITLAGGYATAAERRAMTVERVLPPSERRTPGADRTVVAIDGEAGAATIPARDGDRILVPKLSDRTRNRVTIKGNVYTPGDFGLGGGLTVSSAIRAAGGIKSDTYLGRILVSRLRADSTRVQLRTAFADASGRVSDDFALQEDDEVTVFSLTDFRPRRYVTIAGAVKKGGRFPYREGITLRDLVLLAGGMQESAYLNEAEIARLPENRAAGATAVTRRVPMDSSYLFERGPDGKYDGPPGIPSAAGGSAEVTLEPYDNVVIFRQPDWELQRTVWLTGEVKFPGQYSLRTKTERIASVIERAGGLTSEAYPEGAYFKRSADSVGRVAVNVRGALRGRQDAENMVLADNDSLHIPRYNPVVQVRGAVNSPSAVSLNSGAKLDFYVRSGGGANRRGDVGRAYVIQPNGLVETIRPWPWWVPLASRKPVPLGGAVVVVPEKDPAEAVERQARLSQILATVTTLATIIAVLAR
jgi:protein involved in polysaccharide export with SLBB domain